MFTGIISETPSIYTIGKNSISIKVKKSKDNLGDSIAINGICLTLVKKISKTGYTVLSFDVSPETKRKTAFSTFKKGTRLNLERAMSAKDAFGGHMVQGHVDTIGLISRIQKKGDNKEIWVSFPNVMKPYLVPQGSVTMDGISLTVARLLKNKFMVAIIPHTLKNTNLKLARVGSKVNLEGDIIGKYVAKYVRKK